MFDRNTLKWGQVVSLRSLVTLLSQSIRFARPHDKSPWGDLHSRSTAYEAVALAAEPQGHFRLIH